MKPDTSISSRLAWPLLLYLTFLNILNFADRTLLGSLSKQVHEELGISYAKIGLLTGFGFAIFYTFIGVMLGTVADRWHRPRLIAIGLFLFSLLTVATGRARNFVQLAACRAIIGVGEATLTPAALSMLSEIFKPRWRAFASGFYYAGIPLGYGAGMIISGFLLPAWGWRGCFIIVGSIGIVFVLPLLFLKDPRRNAAIPDGEEGGKPTPSGGGPGFFDLMGRLFETARRAPSLICIMLAAALMVFAQSAAIFNLTWMQEDRGLSFEYVAGVGGWIYLCGGTIGSVAGGLLSDWFHRRFSGGRLWFLSLVICVNLPVAVLFYLGDVHAPWFKIVWFLNAMGSMIGYGTVFSSVQDLVPRSIRATALGFLLLVVNLLGYGPGAWIPGKIADHSSFTTGMLVSVAVAFLALPFSVIAALRFRKDAQWTSHEEKL